MFVGLIGPNFILHIYILIVNWDLCFLNENQIVERLVDQLLRLELNLLLVHLFAEISCTCLVSWDQIHCQLSTMLVFTDYWKSCWVIEHICKSFCCQKSSSDQSRLLRVPKGIIGLVQLRNLPCLKILLGEVFNDIVTVR